MKITSTKIPIKDATGFCRKCQQCLKHLDYKEKCWKHSKFTHPICIYASFCRINTNEDISLQTASRYFFDANSYNEYICTTCWPDTCSIYHFT